jgi:hypothetical protein
MFGQRWRVALVALAALVLVAGGLALVGSRAGGTGACDRPREDPLDPRSLQHSLPGAPPPTYETEPPTSGPHQPGRLSGVVNEPVPGPIQVGALEAGQVLLQHRDLGGPDRERLESLAGQLVVVAPNPALPAPVVATAWRTRQQCRSVDLEVLGRFVRDHAGRDPAHAG